ncbi:MAG TPA: glycosyltransferase 87 family protein [Candidatus Eremiobacteraceae bacterium]|nr:glycosyltransferase 87 family protein [Candidatus Eremiobacteraceae bacterium]
MRLLGWTALAVALIVAYALASAQIAGSLIDFNDLRHHVDFTVGLALPVHVAWQALGEWRLTLCLWALVAGLAIAGTQIARAMDTEGRARSGVLVGIQALLLLALLAVTVTLSGDVYAYVIYGRLYGLLGLDPYLLGSPVNVGSDQILRQALAFYGNPPPPDNYGPLWTLLAGGIARVEAAWPLGAQVWSHRILSAGGALAATTGLLFALRGLAERERVKRAARFALHPLVLYETAVGGHNDMLMAAAAIWAFAVADELPLVAGLLLGASIAVKYVSIVLVPFLVIRVARKGATGAMLCAGISIALPALLFRPFWNGIETLYSLIGHGGVLAMSPQWLADMPFFSLGTADNPVLPGVVLPLFGQLTWPRIIQLAALAAFVAIAVVSVIRYASGRRLAEIWRTLTSAVYSLSIIHPWYALWTAPSAVDSGRWGAFGWWLGVFVFLRYALDGIAPAELGSAYTPLLAALAAVMLVAPMILAFRDTGRDTATAVRKS